MFTCGSHVDNVHEWAAHGQLFTGRAHVEEGIHLELFNQSETALQKIYGERVDSCGERGSKTTYFIHIVLFACPRVITWLSCAITIWSHVFFMCFACAIHETRNL